MYKRNVFFVCLIFSSSLLAAIVIAACTDAGLAAIDDSLVEYIDDKLSITGEFCTSPADEVIFPVKLLIVMDQSASLQCTDPGNNRLTALDLMGGELDPLPNVEFGVVGFASWSAITEFTHDWSVARDALAPEGGQGGPATDYQGALSTVLRVLEQDMVASGPAETARTKYMVLFFSDGCPEPKCNAGCDDDDDPPGGGVCNTLADIPDDVYVDMNSVCPDYNQPEQIMQKVSDIMSLGDFYGVGDISLSAILLFTSLEEIDQVCPDAAAQFGYDKDEALPLLLGMAEEGLGTFRDIHISTDLDFLNFNFESLRAPYGLAGFFALNMNAIPTETGAAVDSDRDGLPDDVEFIAGLDRLSADTDGDGFSDLFEFKFASKGFDPEDADIPAMGCAANLDRDGDGLRECEEIFLGSDPLLPDTDGDRIPDGIELRLGMDATVHDTKIDHDFDGVLSGDEVAMGTSPLLFDEEELVVHQVHYSVVAGDFNEVTENRCYDFTVQNVTLVPSLRGTGPDDVSGTNRILIFAQEEPESMAGSRGRFWVACIDVRYLGDTYKDPPSGWIRGLSPLRFVETAEFDPDLHCLQTGEDPGSAPVEE